MKKTFHLQLVVILFAAISFAQQSTGQSAAPPDQAQPPIQFASNTVIPAELSKSVDAKKCKVGDPVEAKSVVDMLANGQIVMPRNSKILGHIVSVKAHSKESPDSMVGITFDRAVMKDGREMPLPASLQAIGPPLNAFAASSGPPSGGLSPGLPSGGGGGGMAGGQRSGSTPVAQPSQPSYPPNGSGPSSAGPSASALSPSSQGAVGMRDFSLSTTPQASVVSSSTKNVHLDSGTQLILRVQ